MISIIICSRTEHIQELLNNIKTSIGTHYEIVLIDNSNNTYNIFEAYNIGVEKSIGDILCFMHDDIIFHTINWGSIVNTYFDHPQTGAIGVAGSPYAAKMPGSWWAGELVNQQLLVKNGETLVHATKYSDGIKESSKPVVTLDGIWLCIRKELFSHIKFDEHHFKGYHFYDIDICLQIVQLKYDLYCIYDIDMEHISVGNVNEQWIKNALTLKRKWKNSLPLQVMSLSEPEKLAVEFKTLKEFIQILMVNDYSVQYSYKFALKEILEGGFESLTYRSPSYFLYFFFKYIKNIITLNKSNERTLR